MNPTDPAAKPPAVKRVTTILPKGGHYDPNVPGSCAASDLELMLLGPAACPVDSRIGGGVITLDTGLPALARILTADVEFFNNAADPAGEFIYVNTVRATPLRTVIRADVTTGKTITNAPFLPGTLPDGAAIDTVDITLDRITRVIDGQRRGYITTPSRCPRRGYWRSGLRFEYSDIAQTVWTRSRCNR